MSTAGSDLSIPSNAVPFKVYYRHNSTLIELKFQDSRLRVQEVISSCVDQLSDQYMIKLNNNFLHYALYPAGKGGMKATDALQISHGQRIKGVGVRRFYLQYLNLSKESISTQINLQKKYGFQKKIKTQHMGCCSIFSK